MVEIHNVDYNEYIDIIGTAHFTRRSLDDAYHAIKTVNPRDVAIELDWERFRLLNTTCLTCPKRNSCRGLCEFIGASDALGNTDANIWLIDMTEREIKRRIKYRRTPFERQRVGYPISYHQDHNPVQLWEMGLKDRVVNSTKRQIEAQRNYIPSVWGVLLDERNALMAARLAWIASTNLNEGRERKILTFVGAAHVEGIRKLLRNPQSIQEDLDNFKLRFTGPTLIRRVAIQEI
jgi:pheromone shutdown protein TraB